jgi:molybdopterin molybdotransferase
MEAMLSVVEAQKQILEQARPLPPRPLALAAALGLVLAEDIVSDLDMPPYDKAMMDGFALRCADLNDGRAELTIVEEVMAGQMPQIAVAAGEATRIMTGAPLPSGVDTVVMSERCEVLDSRRVAVNDPALRPGQNLLKRGREMSEGEVVLRAGTPLRPQELGLLAAVGRTAVALVPRPRTAVLATGDELVDSDERPGPGQIRNSNAVMLCAQVQRAGGEPHNLGIARDAPEELKQRIAAGLHFDVLILSGGVSAGQRDLVPSILAALGVRALFHHVAMKPGKPVLFGILEQAEALPRLVFGLPGNPVSSLVCFELFVRPALRALLGLEPGPRFVSALLSQDFPYRSERPTYHPARLQSDGTGWRVEPVAWFGSADLRGVSPANAFVLLPAGAHHHRAGQTLSVLCVDDV